MQHLQSLHRSGIEVLPKAIPQIPADSARDHAAVDPAADGHRAGTIDPSHPGDRAAERGVGRANEQHLRPRPVQASPSQGLVADSSLPGGERPLDAHQPLDPTALPKNPSAQPAASSFIRPACLSLSERKESLDLLQNEVVSCSRCPALVRNRTQTVFGVGNIKPRLCFFGEAPGADEDRIGQPFVGRAGQLLDKIIEACTLRREDVYILNTLKCRPPENRAPTEDEVENCRDFFERQLAILQPEFVCCLGATAAKALLRTNLALGRLRGRLHDVQGYKVIVTYHPAYLLRNPAAKKDTWEDMKILMKEMGIELPQK